MPASNLPVAPLPPGGASLGLTVAAVARRLGVAPATLRTWDRRYGLGPSHHAAGAHRRYSPEDVARLECMRRHVLAGVAPVDAARAALVEDVDLSAEVFEAPGGGDVVVIPGGTPNARGLSRAALSLDGDSCRAIIAETLDRRGVVWTWDHLIVPVLVSVGQKWEMTGRAIDVEHVLSESIQSELSSRIDNSRSRSATSVILAGAAGEFHVLPLWALAAGLAERHVSVRMLGARMPTDALGQAMRRTGPGGVVIWSQTSQTGDPLPLVDLPELRPEPLILLAGPGWRPGEVPRGERVNDLCEAIAMLTRAAGA